MENVDNTESVESVEITVTRAGKRHTIYLDGSSLNVTKHGVQHINVSALFPDRSGPGTVETLQVSGISTMGQFITCTIETATPPPLPLSE